MLSKESGVLAVPFAIGLSAGGTHAVITGGSNGWLLVGVGAAAGVVAALSVPRVVAGYRARNRAEFQDAAAVVDPTVRAVFRRAAWALAVTALLWLAVCVVSAISLVGSAHTGSGAFGVTVTVFLAVIGITVATGVALRRLLGGVPSGARWGSASAALMGIGYVGSVSEAGSSGPQQIAGAGLAGFAGLLMMVLDRAHRTARRAGAARE